MKLAPLYRRVLKRLNTATTKHPYHVQDIRFLLSLPVVESFSSLTAPTSTEETGSRTDAAASSPVAENATSKSSSDFTHLHRMPIDGDALFKACRRDLYNALLGTAKNTIEGSSSSSKMASEAPARAGLSPPDAQPQSPVNVPEQTSTLRASPALQVLETVAAIQMLNWLDRRLADADSVETAKWLEAVVDVSKGEMENDERDFIPDSFFTGRDDFAADPDEDTGVMSVEDNENESVQSKIDRHVRHAASAGGGSSSGATGEGAENSAMASPSGNSNEAVVSAAAMGVQRELFSSYKVTKDAPIARYFLSASGQIDSARLAACAMNSHKELCQLVSESLRGAVQVSNDDMELTVQLPLLDSGMTVEQFEKGGYFPESQLFYSANFNIKPLREGQHVQVVNTHLAFYDVFTKDLIEEVGAMPAMGVIELIRERDWSVTERENLMQEKTKAEGSGSEAPSSEPDVAGTTSATAEEDSDFVFDGETTLKKDEGEIPSAPPSPRGSIHSFSIATTRPDTPGPVVVKGMMYYRVGSSAELLHEPTKVISFGLLQMGK